MFIRMVYARQLAILDKFFTLASICTYVVTCVVSMLYLLTLKQPIANDDI